jgi:ubiquinone/menaquinone biosynthesis C-methylase UbiE
VKSIKTGDLEKNLQKHVENTWAKWTKRSPKETAQALLSFKRAQTHYKEMLGELGNLKDKKLLEIGSGYNIFLALCLKDGIKAQGIEPANTEFYKFTLKIGNEILSRAGFNGKYVKEGIGEKLPYKNGTFDIVTSFYTLEHVQSVERVIKESTRVLKKGGVMYHVIPNYGSFWEGHYGIVWLPYMPKLLAKLYVRLWGKSEKLLNEITFVNQLQLEGILKKLPVTAIEWGNKEFARKLTNFDLLDTSTLVSANKILKVIKFLQITKLIILFAKATKSQTPIILIAKKNK